SPLSLHGALPIYLAGSDAYRGAIAHVNDGIALHVLDDPPGKIEIIPLGVVRHAFGDDTHTLPELPAPRQRTIPKLNQDAAGYASSVDHLVTPRGGQRSVGSSVLLLHDELEHVRLELRRDNDLGKDRSEEHRLNS